LQRLHRSVRYSGADDYVVSAAAAAAIPSMSITDKKGKVLPYSLPRVGHGADPCVQAVSPQVT